MYQWNWTCNILLRKQICALQCSQHSVLPPPAVSSQHNHVLGYHSIQNQHHCSTNGTLCDILQCCSTDNNCFPENYIKLSHSLAEEYIILYFQYIVKHVITLKFICTFDILLFLTHPLCISEHIRWQPFIHSFYY